MDDVVQVPPSEQLENALVAGELSLDGVVRHIPGIISMVSTAAPKGMRRAFETSPLIW